MKIPIFEEILLNELSNEKLKVLISDSRIGKVPCYINLTNFKKEEIENLVLNLEQLILENNLHPLFPYPLYIVTTSNLNTIIPKTRSVKDLPDHYFKKIKRPNNKELQLLNKLSLKVEKIKNLELYKVISHFRHTAISQKKLYNETKELYFLENIFSQLCDTGKTKS